MGLSSDNAGLGTKLGFRLVYGACYVVGLLPWWFLYGVLAEAICFLLHRVARYRVKVVRSNLESSFPEKDKAELRRIERGFYHNLSECFVDAVDLASMTRRQWLKRVVWRQDDRDELNRLTDGRNWLVLLAHYGSWELMSAYGMYPDAAAMVSVYRPLNNRVFDMYYHKIRNRMPKIDSIPMNDLLRYYMSHRDGTGGHPLSVALIADQNPPLDANVRWVRFLNHPTVFFHGGEKIARKFGLSVYFMHIRKTGRGRYEQSFELIWDGVSPTEDYAITGEYVRLLEEEIERAPELWLWSHRRWKRRPHGEAAREYNEKYGTDYPQ